MGNFVRGVKFSGDLMLGYCEQCSRQTLVRFLDCEEHGRECNEIVCCGCGSSIASETIINVGVAG